MMIPMLYSVLMANSGNSSGNVCPLSKVAVMEKEGDNTNRHYLMVAWCAVGLAINIKGLFDNPNITSGISLLHSLVDFVLTML